MGYIKFQQFSELGAAVQSACTHFSPPVPEIAEKNFVAQLGPQYPKIPLELILDHFWGPGAFFQRKNLKTTISKFDTSGSIFSAPNGARGLKFFVEGSHIMLSRM